MKKRVIDKTGVLFLSILIRTFLQLKSINHSFPPNKYIFKQIRLWFVYRFYEFVKNAYFSIL